MRIELFESPSFSGLRVRIHGSANCQEVTKETGLRWAGGAREIAKEPGGFIDPAIDREIGIFGLSFVTSADYPYRCDVTAECIFTLIKNGQILRQETRTVCPEVEKYCDDETCPDGTCECNHGSVVCCHDSKTGEVVKQFRKTK